MNIAFFSDTYFPQINGVLISIINYATLFKKLGHTVYIFAPEIPDYRNRDKNVITLDSFKVLSAEPDVRAPLPKLNKKYQKMFNVPIDIVHAHGNGAFSLLGLQVARIRTIPFTMTFHTLDTKYGHYVFNGKVFTEDMIGSALAWFGNLCDGIVAPSKKMQRTLKKYGVRKPMHIIPSFIFQEEFRQAKSGYLRHLLQIEKDEPILLTVGRLGKEKNFEFLLHVAKKVIETHPSLHFVIVGKGSYEEHLKHEAVKLSIEKNVHITGQIERKYIPDCYKDADIFAFSSTTETQGIVVLEAAASGLPLVVVNDGAYERIVEHEVNGYRLPLKQKVFAEHINKLLDSPDIRSSFGKESVKIAAKNFDPTTLAKTMISFYEETIRTSKRKRPMYKQFVNRNTMKRLTDTFAAISNFFAVK
jgi:glycosyltransferase involved in cell wall biosynthesis